MALIRQCLVCDKEFKTYPSKIKIGRGKYCSKECCLIVTNKALEKNGKKSRFKKGQLPHNFKGYRYTQARKTSGKYKMLYMPDHPNSTKSGYVREHRYIMELELGRLLRKDEIVHHKDGNTLNNQVENLEVMNKIDHDRMNTKLNVHKRWQVTGINPE